MKIPELQQKLKESHAHFMTTIRNVSDADFTKSVDSKWSAGQQLEHIVKAVSPVNLAFSLPRPVVRLLFGKANRPSRTYDELVTKYQSKLSQGERASRRFTPDLVHLHQREALFQKLDGLVSALAKKIAGYSEEQLDVLLLPHPLLGKLTLREMIYFTIYHAGHHEKQVRGNLE